jgi:hypothetical protein
MTTHVQSCKISHVILSVNRKKLKLIFITINNETFMHRYQIFTH